MLSYKFYALSFNAQTNIFYMCKFLINFILFSHIIKIFWNESVGPTKIFYMVQINYIELDFILVIKKIPGLTRLENNNKSLKIKNKKIPPLSQKTKVVFSLKNKKKNRNGISVK